VRERQQLLRDRTSPPNDVLRAVHLHRARVWCAHAEDKVIVVTSASRGIGEAIAHAAVEAGAKVEAEPPVAAHRLALAGHADEPLANVAAHDHLGRQQLDHLGDVRLDALALASARRASALAGGHRDRG
jgi:NAD(P)-dependent dehydrogenase (short-subunit alcohol dehydrogenase family)